MTVGDGLPVTPGVTVAVAVGVGDPDGGGCDQRNWKRGGGGRGTAEDGDVGLRCSLGAHGSFVACVSPPPHDPQALWRSRGASLSCTCPRTNGTFDGHRPPPAMAVTTDGGIAWPGAVACGRSQRPGPPM